jgi:hypothetical protein
VAETIATTLAPHSRRKGEPLSESIGTTQFDSRLELLSQLRASTAKLLSLCFILRMYPIIGEPPSSGADQVIVI